jgi:hypothetical protein
MNSPFRGGTEKLHATKQLCRTYGARYDGLAFPGLTPWANLWSRLTALEARFCEHQGMRMAFA